MGCQTVGYRIGGVNIQIRSYDDYSLLHDHVLGEFAADGVPDLTIDLTHGEPDCRSSCESIGIEKDKIRTIHGNIVSTVIFPNGREEDTYPYHQLVMNARYPRAALYLRSEEILAGGHIPSLRRPAGEILMRYYLSRWGGAMLHSCGIVDDNKGYIFVGSSGSGKSTLAKLWRRTACADILSDEYVIIRSSRQRFRMYGTPWFSNAGTYHTRDCDLSKIFIIEHASANYIVPISGVEAMIPCLSAATPVFCGSWRDTRLIRVLAKMVQTIPCYRLGFVPDSRIVDTVRNTS